MSPVLFSLIGPSAKNYSLKCPSDLSKTPQDSRLSTKGEKFYQELFKDLPIMNDHIQPTLMFVCVCVHLVPPVPSQSYWLISGVVPWWSPGPDVERQCPLGPRASRQIVLLSPFGWFIIMTHRVYSHAVGRFVKQRLCALCKTIRTELRQLSKGY